MEVVGHPAAARVSSLGCSALESLKAASEGTWGARRQMALGLSGCAAWLLAATSSPPSLGHPPTAISRQDLPLFYRPVFSWSVRVDGPLDPWFGCLLSEGEGGG